MQVAHQFEQVDRFVTDHRFIAILQHVAAAPIAAIKRSRIASQQRAQTPGQGVTSGVDQQRKGIGQQGLGRHRQGLRCGHPRQLLDEILPLGVSLKEPLPCVPPRHHMVQRTGGIESGTTRHNVMLTITRISLQRPLNPPDQRRPSYPGLLSSYVSYSTGGVSNSSPR